MLEVMTAAAIMAVAMSVATAIFVTLVSQRREGERLLEVQSSGMSAFSQIQVDLANAGYRFPAPAFGVHVFNNATQLSSGGAAPTYVDSASGCGTGGLATGADAIEVVQGSPAFLAGKVQIINSLGPADFDITLAAPTPFTTADVGPSGLALFYDRRGESCIGEVTAGPGSLGSARIQVRMLNREFEPLANAAGYYTNNCPATNMSVYRFESRKRFFLCSEAGLPDGGNVRYSLYSQTSRPDAGGGYVYLDPPAMLQDGLEDLQITSRVKAGPPTAVVVGADCDPAPMSGGSPHCTCNASLSSSCDFSLPVTTLTAASAEANLVGVQVEMTAIGNRPMKDADPTAGKRPASRDHIAGTSIDGFRRLQSRISVGMNNITQVRP